MLLGCLVMEKENSNNSRWTKPSREEQKARRKAKKREQFNNRIAATFEYWRERDRQMFLCMLSSFCPQAIPVLTSEERVREALEQCGIEAWTSTVWRFLNAVEKERYETI